MWLTRSSAVGYSCFLRMGSHASVAASNAIPASANRRRCFRCVQYKNAARPQTNVVPRISPALHERKRQADFRQNLGKMRQKAAIIATAMGA
jgi:hypothetical protein